MDLDPCAAYDYLGYQVLMYRIDGWTSSVIALGGRKALARTEYYQALVVVPEHHFAYKKARDGPGFPVLEEKRVMTGWLYGAVETWGISIGGSDFIDLMVRINGVARTLDRLSREEMYLDATGQVVQNPTNGLYRKTHNIPPATTAGSDSASKEMD